jgi:PAS domain S-box-containing protein
MPIREQLSRMTPVRFVALWLATIFVTEVGIMFVLPVMVSTHASKPVAARVDAFLLIVILAPVLWWMVIHPLQSGIVSEHQRAVAIMHGAYHGIITIDEAGSVESVNPEAERLFGYREEELLGKPVTLLMPERYRARHQAGMDRARSTATSPHHTRKIIEVEGLRKDGSEFQLELSMIAWQSAGARKYAGFVRDITARKRAEAELLRLRKAVETAGEVILLTDPVGTITFVNPAFTELYGYEAREVVGLTRPRILKGGTMSPADYETLWKAITVKETVRREFVNKTALNENL